MDRVKIAGELVLVAKELIALDIPDQHQLRILKDTVKNPTKGKFLGGPSEEVAVEILKKKFHFTDKDIERLRR